MKVLLFSLVVLALTSYSFASVLGLSNLFSEKGDSHSTLHQCPIKLYKSHEQSFTGEKIYANAETFHPLLDILADYAHRCHLKLNIKQSFVPEKSTFNSFSKTDRTALAFQLGEAIEFQLVDKFNKVICDRSCMELKLSHVDRFTRCQMFHSKNDKRSTFSTRFS